VEDAYRKYNALKAASQYCQDPPDPPEPPPPPPPGPWPDGGWDPGDESSHDPNDKVASGYGPQGFVSPSVPIVYTIHFENVATATAAATIVSVTDTLSPNIDSSTLELVEVGFNNETVPVPQGLSAYSARAAVTTDPNPVSVDASLNPTTGILSCVMQSVDPITGDLPEDPLAGFLPPNDGTHRGEGWLTFTAKPKSGLVAGTTIVNEATIVFDVNAAIQTNVVTSTIDPSPPSSRVSALASTMSSKSFTVRWSGSDGAGSGVASYDVYVSTNGGPYQIWRAGATVTSAVFSGSYGNSYAFYSEARDRVGQVEAAPSTADARTLVRTYLSRPWTSPSTARRNRRFYVYGYLSPRHSGSTRLYFYRKVGRRWRYYTRLNARNYDYKTYTRYRLAYRLRYAGYYRVRAYHGESNGAATYSAMHTFRVR
jgi:hypothetical protein